MNPTFDTQKFSDVRHYLGNKFNGLQTQGDATLLAFELAYCLSAILESVGEDSPLREAVLYSLTVPTEFFDEFSRKQSAAH